MADSNFIVNQVIKQRLGIMHYAQGKEITILDYNIRMVRIVDDINDRWQWQNCFPPRSSSRPGFILCLTSLKLTTKTHKLLYAKLIVNINQSNSGAWTVRVIAIKRKYRTNTKKQYAMLQSSTNTKKQVQEHSDTNNNNQQTSNQVST